jgi:transcriptional regulator with XRE-family HTH domain
MASYPSFYKDIKEGMRKKGISLRTLAKGAGIDSSFLSKVLNGKRNPPTEDAVIAKIARILELDSDILIMSAGRIPRRFQPNLDRDEILSAFRDLISGHSLSLGRNSPEAKRVGTAKVKEVTKKGEMPEVLL